MVCGGYGVVSGEEAGAVGRHGSRSQKSGVGGDGGQWHYTRTGRWGGGKRFADVGMGQRI